MTTERIYLFPPQFDALPADQQARAKHALAQQILSARNYAYEASMSDYSMASIDRATRRLAEARATIEASPFTEDDLIETWDGPFGSALRIKLDIRRAELERLTVDETLSQDSRDHYARQLANLTDHGVLA